jgi:hypothetical protein
MKNPEANAIENLKQKLASMSSKQELINVIPKESKTSTHKFESKQELISNPKISSESSRK